MKSIVRLALAVLLGNALGYGLFRLAAWTTPKIWAAAPPPVPFGQLLLLIGITAISFATPPVIVGALAARVAARHEPFVGLATALWGVTARQWWPAQEIPLLPPQSWVAPMTLILVSGLVGGWLAGGRAPRFTEPAHSSSSNESGVESSL
ncbi:MAG TPA: hypothetical protein VJ020_13470 [Anaerolineales bacterium]|nr:hypothetical protein [Anaerolineales bacterium]